MRYLDNDKVKMIQSIEYNSIFDKATGGFARWGFNKESNPPYSPFGPEILDLEISQSKSCSGHCKFCYKSNGIPTTLDHNMTLDEFKILIKKFPKTLCQIAFGICDIDTNPDFFKMMEVARNDFGVIPNYTCNGLKMTDKYIKQSAKLCGAVSVSLVNEKKTFETMQKLMDAGLKIVNMHYVIHDKSYDNAFRIVDKLLKKQCFKYIIFLAYKPKGLNCGEFKSLPLNQYAKLINYCTEAGVKFGVDSCSGPMILKSLNYDVNSDDFKNLNVWQEPCESTLFSSYVNCYGDFYPCSFTENEDGWHEGLNVLNCRDFNNDIWFHPRTIEFRNKLLMTTSNCNCPFKQHCRCCPTFKNITLCKEI